MIENLAKPLQPILSQAYVRRTRRNHALEHATVHMLAKRIPSLAVGGRSDASGFWLIGNFETAQLEAAAAEALQRMRNGERQWAIHPNCGTSLATTGFFMGMAAWLGSIGVRRGAAQYLQRLPLVSLLAMIALIISRPVGLQLQEHVTTLADPGDLSIVRVNSQERSLPVLGQVMFHRVDTQAG
jgi:hypothetical protein